MIISKAGIGRWLFVEKTPLKGTQAIMAVPCLAAFTVRRRSLPRWPSAAAATSATSRPAAWLPWPGAVAYAAAMQVDVRGTGVTVTDFVLSMLASS